MKYLSSLLLPGGIVLLVTNGWFSGQHTVGLIMTIFGGIWFLFALLILIGVAVVFAVNDRPRVPPGVRRK